MPEPGHIESDDSEPTIAGHPLKVGQKFEVKAVSIKEPHQGEAGKVAARLCGDPFTCIALVKV